MLLSQSEIPSTLCPASYLAFWLIFFLSHPMHSSASDPAYKRDTLPSAQPLLLIFLDVTFSTDKSEVLSQDCKVFQHLGPPQPLIYLLTACLALLWTWRPPYHLICPPIHSPLIHPLKSPTYPFTYPTIYLSIHPPLYPLRYSINIRYVSTTLQSLHGIQTWRRRAGSQVCLIYNLPGKIR